jgi:GNAT superfamily N-acetyltransferase
MIKIIRTNSDNKDFHALVKELDAELRFRDGDEHAYYAQFNKIDKIKYVVMAYDLDEAVGCGAIKEYSPDTMEVKRMYVPVNKRGLGIASKILQELEVWVKELHYQKCILETGVKQPEAIRLYEKNNYKMIPNYGQYINMENSVCFEKEIA